MKPVFESVKIYHHRSDLKNFNIPLLHELDSNKEGQKSGKEKY